MCSAPVGEGANRSRTAKAGPCFHSRGAGHSATGAMKPRVLREVPRYLSLRAGLIDQGRSVEARETQPEERPEKERAEDSNWTTYVQTAATIGAGIVGLTAYVYILGGTVLWLRLTAARLPADDVMDAFQDRQ